MSRSAQQATGTDYGLCENIYGHSKRLQWIVSHLQPGDRVLEVGCGTGFMITLPLIRAGWDASGIDCDTASITYGRKMFLAKGLDPTRLSEAPADTLEGPFGAVIVSEVLEHVDSSGIRDLLATVGQLLGPHGRLLVTVPNGYGWYEFESFLWNRLRLGSLITGTRFDRAVCRVKRTLCGSEIEYEHPSTLSSSPHVQRFTLARIQRLIEAAGFDVVESVGTVMFAGPFSNMFFTGCALQMRLNALLGASVPRAAAAFMLACVPSRRSDT